ncbi:MAG TPA: hypothetical protein VFZ48_00350 [Candidatus Saccharimonadales bacterium]
MAPYPGLTKQDCEQAFLIARASLRAAAEMRGVANKFAGTFIVMDPFAQPSSNDPALVSLEEAYGAILFERRVDDAYPDASNYDKVALAKARDLWVLRALLGPNFTGRDVQQHCPHLYRPGMTKWHGAVCRAGIVYAYSGVQGNYDEAFSATAAEWLEAGSREAMTCKGGVMDVGGTLIG